ncbi:uncharacterized protein LOC143588630 [Bidens hawaiensis]|uniref:uncharacterized protein LOC143588630 n=1 Tax=Bidens hawaiensis TaxID=980011 RepID=UPI00404A2E3F
MEQKLVKRVWKLVRVVYFMLRKGISKRKLMLDIHMMIKRGKIAGKTFRNLMFNHHHDSVNRGFNPPTSEYDEFSCTTSPVSSNYYSLSKKPSEDLVMMAMEMVQSGMVSPVLPGFGRSPVIRQLRVTDSQFPLGNVDEDSHVDEEAEQFISRFYNDLRRQNTKLASG